MRASFGCSSNHWFSRSPRKLSTAGSDLGRHELVLGLRGELGVRHLHRQHAGQALAHVVAGQRHLFLLQYPARRGMGVDRPGQGRPEPGEMGSAVALRDVVGEAQDVLVIAVVPLQRRLDDDVVALAGNGDGIAVPSSLVPVEVLDERLDAALVGELRALRLHAPRILENDPDAGVQEREFPQPVFETRVVKLDVRERPVRGNEGDLRSRAVPGVADDGQPGLRLPVGESNEVFLAVSPDAHLQRRGQRVHHRDADAVQPARYLVGVLVELSAGVEVGHDDLCCGNALFLVDGRGHPRPLSTTVTDPSGFRRTSILSQNPASASSMALSTTSYTM